MSTHKLNEQSYEAALVALAQSDPRVMVLTAENRAVLRNLPDIVPSQFCDVGICEQTMVGMAAGMALRGRVPFVHALATFLTMRAFEFIRTDLGIPRLPVKLVGGVPGFLSEANGPTHQAVEDVSIMRGIPSMEVVCPCDEEELRSALPSIVASQNPTYIRFVGGDAAFAHAKPFAMGVAERIGEGTDVAILSYGYLVREAVGAAERLRAQGLSVRVSNMRTLAPVDADEILSAARDAKVVVTVEDHFHTGGLYSIVAEQLVRARVQADVVPIALDGRWFRPTLLAQILEVEGFTGKRLAERILRALETRAFSKPKLSAATASSSVTS